MCNAYKLETPVADLFEVFSRVSLPILKPGRAELPNLPPLPMTRPTNILPIARPLDAADPAAGLELAEARWWLVPFFHKGPTLKDWKPMCTNARAETVATTATYREAFKRRRCLAPADGFYEWTGEKGAKTRWRFTLAEGPPLFAFAGLWDRWNGPDGPVDSFSILTTSAGPDAQPYHNRQPVILKQDNWSKWLDLTADPGPLMQPSPAGTLAVAEAPTRAAAD